MSDTYTPEQRAAELEAIRKARKPSKKPKEPEVRIGSLEPDDESLQRTLAAVKRIIERNAAEYQKRKVEWDELPEEEKRRRTQARLVKEQEEIALEIRKHLPPHYAGASITRSEIADWAEDFVGGEHHGRGLLLVGPTGTGKTFNLYGLIAYLLQHHYDRFLYWQTPLLISALKPRSDSSEWDTLNPCIHAGLLILDDVGAHNPTPFATEKLFQILDHRIAHLLPTVVATNYTPDAAPLALGDRLYSRIVGNSREVKFLGEDRRRS